jgi:S-phase kinase-associated protein 1
MAKLIKLQSSDKKVFEVDLELALQSVTIRNMLEELPCQDEIVPLPNVNSAILMKVINWANYHKVIVVCDSIYLFESILQKPKS